jgi:hypothetical protein
MSGAEVLLGRVWVAASRLVSDQHQTQAVRDAATDVLLEKDMMRAIAGLIPIITAAETAQAAAKDAERDIRALLLDALEQTSGVIRCGALQAAVASGARSVLITDEALIPPKMMRSAPDKAAIAKALKDGPVPGATLSNGGGPTLRITTVGGSK